jgi:hypothetical protein
MFRRSILPPFSERTVQHEAGTKQRSAWCLPHAGFLLCLLLDLGEMGYVFPRNFCWLSPHFVAYVPEDRILHSHCYEYPCLTEMARRQRMTWNFWPRYINFCTQAHFHWVIFCYQQVKEGAMKSVVFHRHSLSRYASTLFEVKWSDSHQLSRTNYCFQLQPMTYKWTECRLWRNM